MKVSENQGVDDGSISSVGKNHSGVILGHLKVNTSSVPHMWTQRDQSAAGLYFCVKQDTE